MSAPLKVSKQVRYGGKLYWTIRDNILWQRRKFTWAYYRSAVINTDFDRWVFNFAPKQNYFDRYNEWVHHVDIDEIKGPASRIFLDWTTRFFTNAWLGAVILFCYYLQIENGRWNTFEKWRQVARDLENA